MSPSGGQVALLQLESLFTVAWQRPIKSHRDIRYQTRYVHHLTVNDRMAAKEKPTVVAQDAIHIERIKKEEKLMKQHTKFHINPFRKLHILPDKPMSRKPPEEVSENSDFIKELHRAYLVPKKKYSTPQTESQEIGWESSPLIPLTHQDQRFHFHRATTDITRHAEYARKMAK
uniref:Cilia and flagella associated protein 144 n=2 Tax=Oryzias melastigma TaxID=30732 RepID=A0A3B3D8Z3_ORYME